MKHISPKFKKLFRIRNALVSRISVTVKEYSTVRGSNTNRVDDRVSILPTSIWWEMCPTATRPAATSGLYRNCLDNFNVLLVFVKCLTHKYEISCSLTRSKFE